MVTTIEEVNRIFKIVLYTFILLTCIYGLICNYNEIIYYLPTGILLIPSILINYKNITKNIYILYIIEYLHLIYIIYYSLNMIYTNKLNIIVDSYPCWTVTIYGLLYTNYMLIKILLTDE